jgi:hypothetical protein
VGHAGAAQHMATHQRAAAKVRSCVFDSCHMYMLRGCSVWCCLL